MSALQKSELERLIADARTGSRKAFSKVVESLYNTVFCFLLSRGASTADAEDLTQETFITAFTKLEQFSGAGAFTAWVLRIARNRFIDKIRKEKQHSSIVNTDLLALTAADDSTPETIVLFKECVKETYARLSPRDRLLLDLKIFQKLSYVEIADIMEVSEATARVAVFRLLARLKVKEGGGE